MNLMIPQRGESWAMGLNTILIIIEVDHFISGSSSEFNESL